MGKQLSNKLDYIEIKPFKVKRKTTEINYKLDLLVKIKIYLVQYIVMLKLVYRKHEPLVYKADTYRGKKEDEYKV